MPSAPRGITLLACHNGRAWHHGRQEGAKTSLICQKAEGGFSSNCRSLLKMTVRVAQRVSFASPFSTRKIKPLHVAYVCRKIERMKYGYARVSTDDQNPALQLAALQKAGCKTVFKDDGLSGATTKRPALLRCLKKLEQKRHTHSLEGGPARP